MIDNKIKLDYFSLVLLIPIIHVLANVTTNYFDPGTLNSGFLRLIYLTIIIFIYFYKYRPQHKNLFIIIIIFLLYNATLILLNNQVYSSLINFIRIAIPLFVYFIGYSVVNNGFKLDLLFKAYLIGLLFFVINFGLANIFDLGVSAYLEDTFNIGGTRAGAANEISIFLLVGMTFLMLNNNKAWHWFTIFLLVFGLIIILLTMRRGAFLTLGISSVIFIYLNGSNIKLVKIASVTLILLVSTFPIYGDTLIDIYNYRVESREGSLANITNEARFSEFENVPYSLSNENAWLTGTHNLNSSSYFGGRELHVGYLAILHGSGVIGLILFITIMWNFYYRGKFLYKKIIDKTNKVIILYALYISLIVAILIYLLTSRLHGFFLTIPSFLFMGSILGYLNKSISDKL